MEIFVKVLQGPYPYLLIAQILVVTMLMLMLIWLIANRTKEAIGEAVNSSMDGASASSQGTASNADFLKQAQLLEAERQRAHKIEEESKAVAEKVKYLETKLLEYEILQEEIGQLSTLKVENEKLRAQVVSLESRPSSLVPQVPVEVKMESEPAPVASLPEPPAESIQPPAELPLEPKASVPAVTESTIPQEPTLAAVAPVAAPELTNATAGIEGIMEQIDELLEKEPTRKAS